LRLNASPVAWASLMHMGLGISKVKYLVKKHKQFFSCVFSNFWSSTGSGSGTGSGSVYGSGTGFSFEAGFGSGFYESGFTTLDTSDKIRTAYWYSSVIIFICEEVGHLFVPHSDCYLPPQTQYRGRPLSVVHIIL
jgi:hypothetical protein